MTNDWQKSRLALYLKTLVAQSLPKDFASELERKFFDAGGLSAPFRDPDPGASDEPSLV
jgi:hypothetical protein